MTFKRLLIAGLALAVLVLPVGSASAAAPGSASASTTESSQVLSFGSSPQKVTIIHDALLRYDTFSEEGAIEGEFEGTCLIKFLKNWTQYNCHGKLIGGSPSAHLENLSSEGVKIVITPSGNITVEITR